MLSSTTAWRPLSHLSRRNVDGEGIDRQASCLFRVYHYPSECINTTKTDILVDVQLRYEGARRTINHVEHDIA